jgi:Domain of unknown function (DUF6379)
MFDKYLIVEDSFKNTREDGKIVGFEFGARLPYYRGLVLSMIEDVAVSVDGQSLPRERIRVALRGRNYSLAAMETEYEERWEMGEVATVLVEKSGGLSPGRHRLELTERLRVSYLPFPLIGKDAKDVAPQPG